MFLFGIGYKNRRHKGSELSTSQKLLDKYRKYETVLIKWKYRPKSTSNFILKF